jgi:hypothetical protein
VNRENRIVFRATGFSVLFCGIALFLLPGAGQAQIKPNERVFPQPKAAVEKAVKQLQSSSSGRLPVLDGFAVPGDRPLERFQRGYYQCEAQVSAAPSGGSLVHVSAKITAWYADPAGGKSGYQVLPSNGRLEADFLDQLEQALGSKSSSPVASPAVNSAPLKPKDRPDLPTPTISAPMPSDSVPIVTSKKSAASGESSLKLGTAPGGGQVADLVTQRVVADKRVEELTKEAKSLDEILRNQAHPNNLVAVKKSSTPVLMSPSEGAKVLFLATAEDEFEMLDVNASWVHVRISGLSRGWLRRASVEMPSAFAPDERPAEAPSGSAAGNAAKQPYHVSGEQIASFPGTWVPLQGKTVKIVTVEKTSEAGSVGPKVRLEFAKSLFEKAYDELAQASSSVAGVVVIFDSDDGGMVAATLPTLQQSKAGTLSDQALWHRCLLDPPEAFESSGVQ